MKIGEVIKHADSQIIDYIIEMDKSLDKTFNSDLLINVMAMLLK